MSVQSFYAGPFSAIYVGTGTGDDVLTPIYSTRSDGGILRYNEPKTFLPVLGYAEQSGNATLNLPLKFLSLDPNVFNLAMNNPLDEANTDDPSNHATYTVLLLAPTNLALSVLLPFCWTDVTIDENFSKTLPTTVPVTFRAENPNRFVNLFYQRTPAALKTLLGGRSPI